MARNDDDPRPTRQWPLTDSVTLGDVVQSLATSRPGGLTPLPVQTDDFTVQIIVYSLRATFNRSTADSLGPLPVPTWEAEGWIVPSGFDPSSEITFVRLHLAWEVTKPDGTEWYVATVEDMPAPPHVGAPAS